MKKILLPTFIVFYFFASNCLTNVEDNTGEIPDQPISFQSDIQPIMNSRCNSCHSNGEAGFNSTSYQAIIDSESPSNKYDSKHVIPEDADNSPLINKLFPSPRFGSRMPLGGSLSGDDIEKIRAWINDGAQNN